MVLRLYERNVWLYFSLSLRAAHPGGRAHFNGLVCVRSFTGILSFESRAAAPDVSRECCVLLEASATGRSLVQGRPYRVCMFPSVR